MKVVFTAIEDRPKLFQSRSPWIARVGKGSVAVAAVLTGRFYRKARANRVTHVTVKIKNKPKLSEPEIQEQNEAEWKRLEAHRMQIESLKDVFSQTQENVALQKKLLEDTESAMNAFSDLFKGQHGRALKNKRYDEDEMIRTYINFVLESGVDRPNQVQLSRYSDPSQETWSRTFQRASFWSGLNQRLDRLWNAGTVVKDKIVLLESKHLENKTRPYDDRMRTAQGSSESESLQGEDAQINEIDMKRYESMTKDQVIRGLLKLEPTASQAELEECSIEGLRKALAIMNE